MLSHGHDTGEGTQGAFMLSHRKCESLSYVQLFGAPMDCGLPGSSVPGILQARILEWVAISSSRESC